MARFNANDITCKGMRVGDYFDGGPYEVANVVGSKDDNAGGMAKAQFWSEHTGLDFNTQKCGILGCGKPAKVGGHMYIKKLSKFCWILPICQACNKNPSLDYPHYHPTKKFVRLVARAMTNEMWTYESDD